MSVHAIAEGLSDRFHLLVGSGRAGPPRQKTLLASIEWSCALLREDERALLRRLSVFASGFSLAGAEAVCTGGEIEGHDVLGLLTSLVDKSLVQVDVGADRFRLHETMRAFASAALDADGGTAWARDRHLDHFTGRAEAMRPKFDTPEVAAALAALAPDLDNVRAALDWGVASAQFDVAARLVAATERFFTVLGLWSEGWPGASGYWRPNSHPCAGPPSWPGEPIQAELGPVGSAPARAGADRSGPIARR